MALFRQISWSDIVDIACVAFVVYQTILLVKGTRAMNMLVGLGLVLVTLMVSQYFNLHTINWLLQSFLSYLVLVLIILFQNDIRKALAQIGRRPFLTRTAESLDCLEEVVRSAVNLASRMTGALIVLERRIGLADYVQAGVPLNASVSRELLVQLFQTSGPLHDGAVIIRGDTILAARCMLPLASGSGLLQMGSRHRAALGLSEEADAVCVVVSEERGRVSVAQGGELTKDLDTNQLRNLLHELMELGERKKRWRFGKG
ncbi:MAG: diadenylate cyclase CdaA [Deltaproteobacteria bacterium]|nr:diadenylate cyclase CdaA [Deltaproteobacteria bacterium]